MIAPSSLFLLVVALVAACEAGTFESYGAKALFAAVALVCGVSAIIDAHLEGAKSAEEDEL